MGKELDLDPDDAQTMTTKLREGIVRRKPVEDLKGEVECDEVYVVAGHKGHPEAVKKKGGPPHGGSPEGGARAGNLGEGEATHLGDDRASAGRSVIRMLENVQQVTIGPLIRATIAPGTDVYTDEYDIYARLPEWGYTPSHSVSRRGGVRP